MTRYEPIEKELEDVRKWQERLAANPPLTTDQLRQQETERFHKAEEQRRKFEAETLEAQMVTDPETNERVLPRELNARNHARAMKAIAERAAQPVVMSDAEMQAAYERKRDLTDRYNRARAESLRPNVDLGKF